jgi:glutamyl-tRNA synthetase
MGVTHVIRGEDHVTNTGAQIALFRALGAEPPVFGHHNLLTTTSGEGLSKRTGALSISALAKAGFEPMAVASLAVLTGTSDNVEPKPSMAELGAAFDLSHVSKSAAKFDPAELGGLNRKLIHHLVFPDVKERLQALGIEGEKAEPFWNAVRGNLEMFSDVSIWWPIIFDGPDRSETLPVEDLDFVRGAFDLLPEGQFDDQTWKLWTGRVKHASGRKGRDLFMPLRIALTGRSSGPELAALMPLFGREGTLARRP